MTTPWITHTSRRFIEAMRGEQPGTVCISISDPDSRPPAIEARFDAILRLNFYDVISTVERSPGVYFVAIHEDQAKKIAEFITLHRGRNIVVHCEAGISRSSAVAEVVLTVFPEYHDAGFCLSGEPQRHPNRTVKNLVMRALGRDGAYFDDVFVDERFRVNFRFFRRSQSRRSLLR